MSEGTPGRVPDADSRTGTGTDGAGQGSTNGRPATPPVQPVRYGPRNAGPRGGANGRDGSNGRTVPGQGSPQQYRAPQPPRPPANGTGSSAAPTNGSGTGAPVTNGASANGASSNGSGANGAGSTGAGANGPGTNGANGTSPVGRGDAGPSSYSRSRTNGSPSRPQPSEQDRRIADARIAAAARNAGAARARGEAPAPTGAAAPRSFERPDSRSSAPSPAAPASDATAVIPVVPAAPTGSDAPAAQAAPSAQAAASGADVAEGTATEKGRGFFDRLRDVAGFGPASAPGARVAEPETAEQGGTTSATATTEPTGTGSSDSTATDAGPTTEERPLTWRDRLGLAPKEPQPVEQDGGPGVPAAAAGAAVATTAAAGAAATATRVPTGPSPVPQPTPVQDRVSPAPPAPVTTDTAIIPAVEGGAVAAPAAVAGAETLATTRPRVGAARRTRKARLRLSRVDPWSVMKTALLFSIAAGIILVVATYGVWTVLNASGLFGAVNDMVKSVVSTPGDTTPFRIEDYINTQKILGVAALIAVVDVLIFTALATLGSFLYNLAATVLGGLEVTLAED